MEAWRQTIKGDYNLLSEEVLGFENDPHQTEWYGVLSDKSLIQLALAAPRGHTKTTCVSVNYSLGEIAENPNVRILLVSNSASQSQSFLREIVGRIERDENYIEYAGELKPESPEKWSSTEIIINRSNLALKDPTIGTVGAGGTILSKRADIIICDDLLNFENTRTYDQRSKLKEWFYQVLLPVLVPGGRLVIVGTVWHAEDLLSELLTDPMFDYRKKFKAVIKEPTNKNLWNDWYNIRLIGTEEAKIEAEKFFQDNYEKMHEGVEILWHKFPYKKLFALDKANHMAFEKMYQNNILNREDQKFKDEWLERAKERGRNYRLIRSLSTDQRQEFKAVTQGIDLAASEETQADDNALLTIGQRRLDDMILLLGLERGHYSPADFRKTIAERATGFKPDRMLVETNGYQVALKRDLAVHNLPIVGYQTGKEKFDPFIGVESMAILFENDRIILPYDKTDPYTIEMVDKLVDELRMFPAGHTGDSAMALWFANTALRDIMAVEGDSQGFFQMIKEDLAQVADKPVVHDWRGMASKQGDNLL